MNLKIILYISLVSTTLLFTHCSETKNVGFWDFEIQMNWDEEYVEEVHGTMKLYESPDFHGKLISVHWGTYDILDFNLEGNLLKGKIVLRQDTFLLEARIDNNLMKGNLANDEHKFPFSAEKIPSEYIPANRLEPKYLVDETMLPDYESNIDHAGIIDNFDRNAFLRGQRIYNDNCINCHGNAQIEGSIPLSRKFWKDSFKVGNDPYSMYQVLSKGYATMPPQPNMTPGEKYDVILYIRENFLRQENKGEYFKISEGYLSQLPKGDEKGPETKPYHPWSDMDYGNFFINTYELVDEETGPARFHSPGPRPYQDEDYSKSNFAYKGIAVRVDAGKGGVSEGKVWMMFDHDVMRVAGGWSGEGFIDWDGILLNDRHETYPRTIGKLHFENTVGPAWANPANGSYDDPRFTARDGRQFGPLPKEWTDFKGIYYYEDKVIVSYSVGRASVLELMGMEEVNGNIIFTRTLNFGNITKPLQSRVAKKGTHVAVKGKGASIREEGDYVVLDISENTENIKLFITDSGDSELQNLAENSTEPESLEKYTKGGKAHYSEELITSTTLGNENNPIAVDWINLPFDNPWKSRMKLSGIDFMSDSNMAVVCTVGGDVWRITGLMDNSGQLKWKRIASGLFQPLGIKVIDDRVFITCRDQIVLLHDLNGDEETDYYESFNHDHQVSDHFHEFAMGLQADEQGNLYYAKSGRHAREALIPQHGTLIKVSKDGSSSQIIAKGFRAANGVCINPDGSFIVTDQQGYWNPMNRINWIEGEGNFYGNMWGYNPPKDTSRAAMEKPLVWVDMEFDNSPSELMWVESEQWGPLNGSLLSFSYGYGKAQLVLHEKVNGQMQGGVIDLPGVRFLTGVMRGRFHPENGYLYACGMSAWGTSQMMKGGGLYRLRYTGKTIPVPVSLNVKESGLKLTFLSDLNSNEANNLQNYEIKTWDLVRSSKYGSDRYNIKTLDIAEIKISEDGKSVFLKIPEINPVDVMTIKYKLNDKDGNQIEGTVQNTIHHLGKD